MKIPDYATRFSDNVTGATYRVSGWLKAEPRIFKPVNKLFNSILEEIFYENCPNWKTEYVLVPCIREEATHVWGTGICGVTADLRDEKWTFLHQYVSWDKKFREKRKQNFLDSLEDITRYYPLQVITGKLHS